MAINPEPVPVHFRLSFQERQRTARAGGAKVAVGLGHGRFAALDRVGLAIARGDVRGESHGLFGAVHTHEDLFKDEQVQAAEALHWVEDDTLGRIPMGSIPGQPVPSTGSSSLGLCGRT